MDATRRAATASEIREIVGELDDAAIAAILRTGATPAEVTEAFMRRTAAELDEDKQTACSGVVAAILDILEEAEAEPEEP